MSIKTSLLWILCFFALQSFGQIKKVKPNVIKPTRPINIPDYIVAVDGDTINRTDDFNNKQGRWIITKTSKYEDYESKEIGNYINNKKNGVWKKVENLKTVALENYKDDKLNGEVKYYSEGFLSCIGNYYGLYSTGKLDSIYVTNPVTEQVKLCILPTDLGSVKEGLWKYFYPNGKLMKEDLYLMDELISSKEYDEFATDSLAIKNYITNMPHQPGIKTYIPFGSKGKVDIPRFSNLPGEKGFVVPKNASKK